MSTQVKVIGFVTALAVVFVVAFVGGRLIGDDEVEPAKYSMRLTTSQAAPDQPVDVRFTVLDADQKPVTRFDVRHEKRLHLVAVSKDFSEFRHVHPTMAADGEWSTGLDVVPGEWRVYADFQPAGATNQLLDEDMTALGEPVVRPEVELHAETTVAGYDVVARSDAQGELVAGGQGAMLELDVTRDGRPVTDLEPYLGAYGHLVVLRASDMKYLHVHPEEGPSGPKIPFHVEVPTAGRYYLYLDFKRAGKVHTAAVVLNASAPADEPDDEGGMEHGGH